MDLSKEYSCNPLLLRVELMSNFSVARTSKWVVQVLNVINQFADEDGIYHYPKQYLTEKDSCWILGNHMSLGENRRKKHALVADGTFRTLIILKNYNIF